MASPSAATSAPLSSTQQTLSPLVRYRWAVASRALAAIGGGYVLSALAAACLALCLPYMGMSRTESVMASTMLSFILYAIAILWVFACRNARRAWLGIALPALVLAMLLSALYN
ncbi:DUF3649 domain-containing protein [Lampropedia puyangensis]|uniref:DUF3649 domain-containing protein n=1 Tax=Lampropedia puyangensis TaxID=1330072 RepID=A0A4S8FDS1_9BURK|nr:DUF3649 domain-containing protein [Lampropedia puyangensis]THU05115.1 DUF3649 domain-containing protein [Lampropedia puyangensis]